MEIILLLGYVPLVIWLLLQSVMLNKYDKLTKEQQVELKRLKPFQFSQSLPFGVAVRVATDFYNDKVKMMKKHPPNLSNVGGVLYNRTMKKRKPPLNKVAQATRNAHSAELFKSLMLNKHLVATPATRKGSRKANIQKAIKEYN